MSDETALVVLQLSNGGFPGTLRAPVFESPETSRCVSLTDRTKNSNPIRDNNIAPTRFMRVCGNSLRLRMRKCSVVASCC